MNLSTYKNNIIITDKLVIKNYSDRENFLNEVRAFELLKGSKFLPRIVEIKDMTIIFEKISREKFINNPKELNELFLDEIAGFISELYSIKSEKNGYLSNLSDKCNPEFLLDKLKCRLSEIVTLSDNDKESCLNYFINSKKNSEWQSSTSLLHYDLKPTNIILVRNGLKVIDFDKASFGDVEMDIAKFFWRTLRFNGVLQEKFINKLKISVDINKINIYIFFYTA
ncbi:phosphotransferase [Carnobacteriaceae bacterium zg-ZUI252]|nr:phosphotransferase [Carnobacteriaceae bacterium zg-ZUI252]MBS4770866.1 phosphotransferase [Carnobacteriaceae bacterium zg-ZUI240]